MYAIHPQNPDVVNLRPFSSVDHIDVEAQSPKSISKVVRAFDDRHYSHQRSAYSNASSLSLTSNSSAGLSSFSLSSAGTITPRATVSSLVASSSSATSPTSPDSFGYIASPQTLGSILERIEGDTPQRKHSKSRRKPVAAKPWKSSESVGESLVPGKPQSTPTDEFDSQISQSDNISIKSEPEYVSHGDGRRVRRRALSLDLEKQPYWNAIGNDILRKWFTPQSPQRDILSPRQLEAPGTGATKSSDFSDPTGSECADSEAARPATVSVQADDGLARHATTVSPASSIISGLESCVTTVEPQLRPPDTVDTRRKGKSMITMQKHLMQGSIFGINGFAIFATWWWPRYYYVLLPFIAATVALNCMMILSIAFNLLRIQLRAETIIEPEQPESMVLLIPCYNETKEELLKSLDSLVAQVNIELHPRAIMIVCDGKVRGPGMEKTTADYLLQDILLQKDYRKRIKQAYIAWDQQFMDVVVQKGTYCDIPYFCIVKQQNQGKRDGLIIVRSFLYNYNIRASKPATIFKPTFFAHMASFLQQAGLEHVDHLVGMDADTVFAETCVWELLEQSRYPNTVGVCGYVAVDWNGYHWDPWRLYQSAEYTIAQGLRRLHQSIVTHKVSCLPGCCQLLKICEETCGPEVLVAKFGYCPTLTDGLLKQIRATASEDRNHVCHMLSARPKVQTRQALRAKAYTDVPHSGSVFLSQRRRWTLGATSNDLLLAFAPGVQWFERIVAAVNVLTWFLNLFIFASVASFIYAATQVPTWIIMCFVSVMLIPVTYYVCIPLWLCSKWRECFQYWAGMLMYVFCGPFINIAVLLYACYYMDSFGWGKTRKVIAEDFAVDSTNEDDDTTTDSNHDGRRHVGESPEPQPPIPTLAPHLTLEIDTIGRSSAALEDRVESAADEKTNLEQS